VIPLVPGIETVLVQVTVPVHVRRTVSPSLAEEIAELTSAAEQSLGPTVMVAASARATAETKIKLVRMILLKSVPLSRGLHAAVSLGLRCCRLN